MQKRQMENKPGFPVITVPADFQEAAEEAQEAAEEAKEESILDKVAAELEAQKDRSAWGRGVNAYAMELVEELRERAAYEGRNPEPDKECREWMLNGAQDWNQYSWGGSSLIYDGDIMNCVSLYGWELRRTTPISPANTPRH